MILSLILLVGEHRAHHFTKIRLALSVVVAPIQYLVNLPVELIDSTGNYLRTKSTLMKENAELKKQMLILHVKAQKTINLENENAQLKALLGSSVDKSNKILAAQLLAVSLNPFDQVVILNKGFNRGVYIGQPVLDAYGVIGQVIEVDSVTSRVLLVTDSRSAVPVQDTRNGMRFIALGNGYSGFLKLVNVAATADLKVGDLLVTSGLGLRFPVGYPVGVVDSINKIPGERFAEIKVFPKAHINSSRQVLLIWVKKNEH